MSSEGILRLDLDLEDAVMPNGTHRTNVDGTDNHKEATVPTPLSTVSEAVEEQLSAEEEPQTEPEGIPQKKVIKPPMPPTKEVKPISVSWDDTDKHDGPEKKVCIMLSCSHLTVAAYMCVWLCIWVTWPVKYDFMF